MYCVKCGSIIDTDSNSCKFCNVKEAKQTEPVVVSVKESGSEPKTYKAKRSFFEGWERALEIIVGIAAFAVGRYLGLTYFVFIIIPLLGWWLASWYSKNHDENRFTKFIAWSNLITWLLPFIGLFTVFASFKFSQVYGKKTKLYLVIAIIGLIATILSMIYGGYMTITGKSYFSEKDGFGYPTAVKTSFVNNCLENSKGRNTTEYLNTYCNCTFDYIEHNLTYDQFNQMDSNFTTIETAPKVIQDGIKACSK